MAQWTEDLGRELLAADAPDKVKGLVWYFRVSWIVLKFFGLKLIGLAGFVVLIAALVLNIYVPIPSIGKILFTLNVWPKYIISNINVSDDSHISRFGNNSIFYLLHSPNSDERRHYSIVDVNVGNRTRRINFSFNSRGINCQLHIYQLDGTSPIKNCPETIWTLIAEGKAGF